MLAFHTACEVYSIGQFARRIAAAGKSMNHLWSPWRMVYILESNKDTECAFCRELAQPDGSKNLIVARGREAFVILNRYPYTSGHLMVVPLRHEPGLDTLNAAERGAMMELVARCLEVLRTVYSPQGFNVGVNMGEAAGAGIREHVHIHIVPRWTGDTNFMSALGHTRVLPESLEDSYERIRAAWQAAAGSLPPSPGEQESQP